MLAALTTFALTSCGGGDDPDVPDVPDKPTPEQKVESYVETTYDTPTDQPAYSR